MQAVVICGPAGAGKTTLAKAWVAEHPAWTYIEGDDLHPPSNIQKMSTGIPLTDAEREPWYGLIAKRVNELLANGHPVVVTCSALRRTYRDWLRAMVPGIQFVFLAIPQAEAEQRVEVRQGHYFKAPMVASQYRALELPLEEFEEVTMLDASQPPEQLLQDFSKVIAHVKPRS